MAILDRYKMDILSAGACGGLGRESEGCWMAAVVGVEGCGVFKLTGR